MLLSNPAASPAFLPTVTSLGALLLTSLAAVLAVAWARSGPRRERAHENARPSTRPTVLLRRWATWATIAPLYVLGVLSGPVVAALFVAALTCQALREYARLVGLPSRYRQTLVAAGVLPGLAVLLGPEAHAALPALVLLGATLVPLLSRDVRAGTRHLALAGLGWAYFAWLLGYLPLIGRDLPGGAEALLALGLAVALGDVGAFVVGKLVGGPRLAPTLSPHKTWAGLVGNLGGAVLGLALLRFALPAHFTLAHLAGLALVVAVGAVWGDLFESSLKREHGAKDAGTWLPGFGGLLDRLDSLVPVLPLAYYYLLWTWP